MSVLQCVAVLALLCARTPTTGALNQMSRETRLVSNLMANYNKHVRPVYNPLQPTNVGFMFSLGRLESLDEKKQVLTSFGWFMASWKDEFLKWSPAAYPDIYRIVLPGDEIWLPEVTILNGVEQSNDLAYGSKFRVTIWYDGTVQWIPGFKWQTACELDLTLFPFEHQNCSVTFINWVYQESMVDYFNLSSTVILDSYTPNGEWTIVETTVGADTMVFEPSPDLPMRLPAISFNLKLKRLSAYFVMNIIVPSILLSAIAGLGFLLPIDSGEKVSLEITVMLSFSVLLLIVGDIIPRTQKMPIIAYFICVNMSFTTVSLIATVGIMNVYHHSPKTRVPHCLRVVVFNMLGKLVGIKHPGQTIDSGHPEKGTEPTGNKVVPYKDPNQAEKKSPPVDTSSLKEVIAYIRDRAERDADDDRMEANKDEWMTAGLILDRTFFLLYLVAVTSMSLYTIIALT